jgi:2-oxo-3-hexenedioate decarboxylase
VNATEIGKWADYLFAAERESQAVPPVTDTYPEFSPDDAYLVQEALLERRLAAGERIVGAKLGLTSRAKQQDMGIDEPIYGWLTDSMAVSSGSTVSLKDCIHPRVEPEIVFVLGAPLAGPGVGIQEVLQATAQVCCGLEVIDSRYVDFRFKLPDVIADNTSACRFAVGGQPVPVTGLDLALTGCLFEEDGKLVASAAGAAILGHPAVAIANLANFLGGRGRRLEPGWLVLSGGLTAARALRPHAEVSAVFSHLGRVSLRGEP